MSLVCLATDAGSQGSSGNERMGRPAVFAPTSTPIPTEFCARSAPVNDGSEFNGGDGGAGLGPAFTWTNPFDDFPTDGKGEEGEEGRLSQSSSSIANADYLKLREMADALSPPTGSSADSCGDLDRTRRQTTGN